MKNHLSLAKITESSLYFGFCCRKKQFLQSLQLLRKRKAKGMRNRHLRKTDAIAAVVNTDQEPTLGQLGEISKIIIRKVNVITNIS